MKQLFNFNVKSICYILFFILFSHIYSIDIMINGKSLDKDVINNDLKYIEEMEPSLKDEIMNPQVRKDIYESIAVRESIRLKGEQLKLEDTKEYKDRLEAIKPVIFAKILAHRISEEEMSSSDLLKSYNEMKGSTPVQTFYKFSQILVTDETVANDLIRRLNQGEQFAKLAKMYSTDFSTKNKGGEINWTLSTDLPKEYITSLNSLKKGEFTKTPLKMSNGFIIIKLDKVKIKKHFKFPSFQEIKSKLVEKLKLKNLKSYLEKIKQEFKVELK